MGSVNMSLRMDEELKSQAEDLFSDLGLSMSTAITIFMKKAVREQRIPFELSRDIPNKDTLAAMEEARLLKTDPNRKTYKNFGEFMREMEEEK